jgi:shikimate kinase/3-dehydroquinate synthase
VGARGPHEHPVLVGRGVLGGALPWPAPGRRFAVTDETVAGLHAGRIPQLAGLVEIPPGEAHKTLATAQAVWEALAAQGATRADHVVALGGGVVGDLAGFCAATYQRGIPVVQVPTTLVAQVDSAYGGKTGVDLPAAKNYVGAYHQPAAVVVDPSTLATLPPAEHAAGYAEVVKTALIAGGALWDRIGSGEPVDDAVILACARTKLASWRRTSATAACGRCSTSGTPSATRSRWSRASAPAPRRGRGARAARRAAPLGPARPARAGRRAARGGGLPTPSTAWIPPRSPRRRGATRSGWGEHTPFVLVEGPGDVRHGRPVAAADLLAAVGELVRP